MRPKLGAQTKRFKGSTTGSVRHLASPELNFTTEHTDGILDIDKPAAMEAVSEEEEDERILNLEAEVEELREQVHRSSHHGCNAV